MVRSQQTLREGMAYRPIKELVERAVLVLLRVRLGLPRARDSKTHAGAVAVRGLLLNSLHRKAPKSLWARVHDLGTKL